MVRASKSATAPAVAPVVDVAASAPKTPRAKKVKVEAAAPAVVEVAAPVAPAVEVAVDPNSTAVKLTELSAKVQQIVSLLSGLKSDLKNVEKNCSRHEGCPKGFCQEAP